MKRLLTLVACALALAALAAVAARGATAWGVTIHATPAAVAPDQTLTVAGVLTGPASVAERDVELWTYSDAQCTVESSAVTVDGQWLTGSDGGYSYDVGAETAGTYYVQAVAYPSLESWDVLAT